MSLTEREQEVLRCLADGLSNKEIAKRLCIAVRTVDKNVANIYKKLGVTSDRQCIAYYYKQRIPKDTYLAIVDKDGKIKGQINMSGMML